MRCAIFCRVIDNFGDIGVCWRLARQLALEYGLAVTLYVDDLACFHQLAPELDPGLAIQALGQITVCHWQPDVLFAQPFDLIIEGFGCRLEDQLIAQMHQQQQNGRAPRWINLEYLSAEDWVQACHGMTSVHPATGLQQTFWFPSVTPASGGLIRETDLICQRNQWQQNEQHQAAFWQQLGIPQAMRYARRVSLFSYENPAMASLLDALADAADSTLLLVPASKSVPNIRQWLANKGASHTLAIGQLHAVQQLTIAILPFLSQQQYDQLLWACDLNFVRGEDSCVRAQWAGKPFIWHIYPQEQQAHEVKLQAWLQRMHAVSEMSSCWQQCMLAWNGMQAASGSPSYATVWRQMLAEMPVWQTHMNHWSDYLLQQSDLVSRLMQWSATPKAAGFFQN